MRTRLDHAEHWPFGSGEMAERVRTHDWAATSLGPIADWPDALRAIVDLVLASPIVATLALLDERLLIYNDAAARLYGDRHPGALGRPLGETFPDSYPAVAAVYDRVFAGEAVAVQAQPLSVGTDGRGEVFDAYLTPVRDAAGAVIGAHMIGLEIGERQRTDAALRDSEARLALAIEIGGIGHWELDLTTGALTTSAHCRRNFGRPEDKPFSYDELTASIHPDDRERQRQAASAAIAEKASFDVEYRLIGSDGELRWTQVSGRHEEIDRPRLVGVSRNISERKFAERTLREAEERQRVLVEGMPQLIWRSFNGGRWAWASPQWTAFTGQEERDSHEFGWLDALHPDDRKGVRDIWEGAVERGDFHADYRVRDRAHRRYRWFQTRATPVRDALGEIVEWLGTSTDVDDLRNLQSRQELLVAELQHRVRNILTVVRSVFGRTVETSDDIEDIADHFRGRLDALARTQVIVTRSAERTVDLEDLVREEMLSVAANGSEIVTIKGPEVKLSAKVAETLGLALHELTTNALKYGALKVPGGRLAISWKIDTRYRDVPILHLIWKEHGVPTVPVRPAREGFGRELIEEALPYRLGAETKLEFAGGGVRCSISIPLPAESEDASIGIEDKR